MLALAGQHLAYLSIALVAGTAVGWLIWGRALRSLGRSTAAQVLALRRVATDATRATEELQHAKTAVEQRSRSDSAHGAALMAGLQARLDSVQADSTAHLADVARARTGFATAAFRLQRTTEALEEKARHLTSANQRAAGLQDELVEAGLHHVVLSERVRTITVRAHSAELDMVRLRTLLADVRVRGAEIEHDRIRALTDHTAAAEAEAEDLRRAHASTRQRATAAERALLAAVADLRRARVELVRGASVPDTTAAAVVAPAQPMAPDATEDTAALIAALRRQWQRCVGERMLADRRAAEAQRRVSQLNSDLAELRRSTGRHLAEGQWYLGEERARVASLRHDLALLEGSHSALRSAHDGLVEQVQVATEALAERGRAGDGASEVHRQELVGANARIDRIAADLARSEEERDLVSGQLAAVVAASAEARDRGRLLLDERDRATASIAADADALRGELERLRAVHERERADGVHARAHGRLALLDAVAQAEVDTTGEITAIMLTLAREQHQQARTRQRLAVEAVTADLHQRHVADAHAAHEAHEHQLEQLERNHQRALAQLGADHHASHQLRGDELRTQHLRAVEDIRAQLAVTVSRLRDEHTERLVHLEAQHASALVAAERAHGEAERSSELRHQDVLTELRLDAERAAVTSEEAAHADLEAASARLVSQWHRRLEVAEVEHARITGDAQPGHAAAHAVAERSAEAASVLARELTDLRRVHETQLAAARAAAGRLAVSRVGVVDEPDPSFATRIVTLLGRTAPRSHRPLT